MPKIHYFSNKS